MSSKTECMKKIEVFAKRRLMGTLNNIDMKAERIC